MASTIVFPTTRTSRNSISRASIMTTTSFLSGRHTTALEVCDFMYGNLEPSSLGAIERLYEANASYENPFLTATSRSVISDIHMLSRRLSKVDVPRPLAMLCTLFGIKPPDESVPGLAKKRNSLHDSLFQALRIWSDIGDICESESFDGHHKTIIEHTLNVLFLPGIHTDRQNPNPSQPAPIPSPHGSNADLPLSIESSASVQQQQHHPSDPGLFLPGTGVSLPSPLHIQLHVVTRLSFNEQGRITHHRDVWDVKDVLGLVPGLSLAQWIGSRLAARSLGFAARIFLGSELSYFGANLRSRSGSGVEPTLNYGMAGSSVDLEDSRGPSPGMAAEVTPAAAYSVYAKSILGFSGIVSPKRDV